MLTGRSPGLYNADVYFCLEDRLSRTGVHGPSIDSEAVY